MTAMSSPAAVLLIGGIDSGGGAGLLRDAETVREHGFTARVAVTAVTAQTDRAVSAIHPVPVETLVAQIKAACRSGPVAAVKIGMLGNAGIVRAVAAHLPKVPVVLDPVLASSSGTPLLDEDGIAVLLADLLPKTTLLTPNLVEAVRLTQSGGGPAPARPAGQAARLIAGGARAVLIKGGHGTGDLARDLLFQPAAPSIAFVGPRIAGRRRGTGCTLASAIACGLAAGRTLEDACRQAKEKMQALFEGR